MSLIKKLKKISCLEIVMFVLLVSLFIVFILKKNKEGFIEEKADFIRYTDNDIYDNFYSNVYDKILFNDAKNNFELDYILKNKNENRLVLDIGCGTGHHVKMLSDNNIKAIGVDNSKSMIKKCRSKYPNLKFGEADVLNGMEFPESTFSDILCLYFTIYYFKNKRQFLENCFKWLKPNGVLILHLVDVNNFDPVVPNATFFDKNSKRPTKSEIEFDKFDYKANFKQDKNIDFDKANLTNPNVIFREVFKFNDKNKARVNEHKLYMSSQQSILGAAKEVGFILKSHVEMKEIQYDYNYLYTLQKPM